MTDNERQAGKIGEYLMANGDISSIQLQDALLQKLNSGKRLGKILIELGYTTEAKVVNALAKTLGYDAVDCRACTVHKEVLLLVTKEFAEKKRVVPLKVEGGRLLLAMADPLDFSTIEAIAFRVGLIVVPQVATESGILELLERNYGSSARIIELLTQLPDSEPLEVVKEVRLEEVLEGRDELVDAAPIVKLVTFIVNEAVRSQASDIHIEPHEKEVNVRLRIDGELRSFMRFPKNAQVPVISRIKILATLDITNRRTPQDGSCTIKFEDRTIDLRISTMPTVLGEKIVIRLLDQTTGMIPLPGLGVDESVFKPFLEMAKWSQGMILVAGPTGSGKTTTLYAVLQQLQTDKKNLVTIENPVEYRLPGVTQIGINEQAGLTFSSTLRSVLRQDPDIIMVGEIRDRETAEIAARAALTGHMVFSTIHTNNTVATIARLYDLGLEPFLINSAVTGIMAQRLVKRICRFCRTEVAPDELAKTNLLFSGMSYRGNGCRECQQTGYKGRVGIYEFLPMTKEIRHLVARRADEDELWVAARAAGTVPLLEAAWGKVAKGETTAAEVLLNIMGGGAVTAARRPEILALDDLRALSGNEPAGSTGTMAGVGAACRFDPSVV